MMLYTRTVIFIYIFHMIRSDDPDYIKYFDKTKLINLGHEMIVDAKIKLSQVDGIRTQHSYFTGFEVGYVMGTIREKYRLMMETYRLAYNRINRIMIFSPAKTGPFRSIHYFVRMEYVHLLQLDIDKLIDVLERMPEHQQPFAHQRTGDRASEEEEKHNRLEEEVKRRYREEYLMRKLSSPGHSTTRKRFVAKWPVADTWDLDKYKKQYFK